MNLISWPTKRLLMAEIGNERDDETGDSREGRSSPGGETPATLGSALDALRQGYTPYAGFPSAFAAEELKLLIAAHGPEYEASDLLTDLDWTAHARCDSSESGEGPLAIQVDGDLADFLRQMAECNGIDLGRYANGLLERAVLAQGGVGVMILSKSQAIGGHRVGVGHEVRADPVAGDLFRRTVTVEVGRQTVTGEVALGDLAKPEHYEQDRLAALRRTREALKG